MQLNPGPEQPLWDWERSRGLRTGFLSPHLAHLARPLRKQSMEHVFLLGTLPVTQLPCEPVPVGLTLMSQACPPTFTAMTCCPDLSHPRSFFFSSLCHIFSVKRSCSVFPGHLLHTQGSVLLQTQQAEQRRWTCEHEAGAQLWPDVAVFPGDVPALDAHTGSPCPAPALKPKPGLRALQAVFPCTSSGSQQP